MERIWSTLVPWAQRPSALKSFLPAAHQETEQGRMVDNGKVSRKVEMQRETVTITEVQEARQKGYEGDPCQECKQFTMVRNGMCLKCANCGATNGCS